MPRKGENLLVALVVGGCALLAFALLLWWLGEEPAMPVKARVATPDDHVAAGAEQGVPEGKQTDIKGQFEAFAGRASETVTGSWPRFRGADADNICKDPTPLLDVWPENGPPVLWDLDLGEGHAGPVVRNGCVYILDYDEERRGDALRCFSLDDGREIWRRWYKVQIKRNHGMSRTVPAVSEKYVVSIGPKCHVLCVDADSGAFRWGLDLAADFGTKVPLWYTGQCPMIDNGVAVIAPAGKALLMGVDCETGETVWETPNPDGWKMSHSSVTPATIGGRRMYLYCAVGGMVGVAADGPDVGGILWSTTDWNQSVIAPSPVPLSDGRIFLTAGYGGGSLMIKVTLDGAEFAVESLFRLDKSVFACEQQTPIWYKDHLFSVLPNDAGELKRQLACMSPDGSLVWTSGKSNRYGLGPFLVADDKLLVLTDDGELSMLRADPAGFTLLAKAKILDGRDAWGPMALVNGRLLVRDWKRMLCLDLRRRN